MIPTNISGWVRLYRDADSRFVNHHTSTTSSNEQVARYYKLREYIFKKIKEYDLVIEDMADALIDARNAIHSLPIESLGVGGDSGETRWAIRDELIYNIEQALKKAGVQF